MQTAFLPGEQNLNMYILLKVLLPQKRSSPPQLLGIKGFYNSLVEILGHMERI